MITKLNILLSWKLESLESVSFSIIYLESLLCNAVLPCKCLFIYLGIFNILYYDKRTNWLNYQTINRQVSIQIK